jgi:hypothetical protein
MSFHFSSRIKLDNILQHFAVFSLILLIPVAFVFIFWTYYPYKVITFNKPPLELVTDTVKPGGKLEWKVDINHFTSGIKVDVVRELQDGYIINMTPTSYITSKGRQVFTNSITVPTNAAPGEYKLSVTSVFHINPIRDITFTYYSKEFTITK